MALPLNRNIPPARRMALPRRLCALLPALLAPALPYGGQAAIEGVMMKGTAHAALAVRRRDGRVEVLERPANARFPKLAALPGVRGLVILIDMLGLGMWALRESAHRFEIDAMAAEAEAKGQVAPVATAEAGPPTLLQQVVMVVSLAIALVLFKLVPAAATTGIYSLLGWGLPHQVQHPTMLQQFIANLIEGAIKFGIFVGYIWLVGRIAEIKRVFEYHGAEHIVINAYEDDASNQSIPFIQTHSVAHPRCGTSFIVILILLSIFLFTFLDWLLILAGPALNAALPAWWLSAKWLGAAVRDNLPAWYLRWPLRIVGLIPLAGISYEVIKAAFKCYSHPLLRPLLRFGMLFQTLTTRRPSDAQVEVSLASFNRARYLTEGIAEPAPPCPVTTAATL
jgi:uncharacterized protein YqhQ